jgi:hypothetical protein|tara:strand:- start:75 stop:350 length:276 start_codon:yes stop_codon:yes gene_type:complete
MKKLIISLLFTSCTIHHQYSPVKLKNISKDMLVLRQMLQEDYENGLIKKETARNYFNLMETYAFDLEKEYQKAKAKRDGTKVYKIITISKR